MLGKILFSVLCGIILISLIVALVSFTDLCEKPTPSGVGWIAPLS